MLIISQVNSIYPIWTQKLISDGWKGGRRAQAWAHNCDTTRQWQKNTMGVKKRRKHGHDVGALGWHTN